MIEKKISILTDILGGYIFSRNEILFYCPFCKHHKRKLSVNIEKNVWKCWICDVKGVDIYALIKKLGSLSQKAEWRTLSGIIDQSSEENLNFLDGNQSKLEPVKLPEEFRTLSSKKENILSVSAKKYLLNRGLTEYDIVYWKIGYCADGTYKDRIIIPSFDLNGDINYFVARNYKNNFLPYKNPSAPHDFIFNELYLDWEKDIVLCEGVFDAIVASNAIPLLGSTFREDSYTLKQLVVNNAKVYLALDPDAKDKEDKIKKILLAYGLEVYKINVSPFKDIGEMSKEIFLERKLCAKRVTNDSIIEEMLMSM